MNSRERLQKFRSYKEGQAVEIARDWEIAHLDPLKERTEKEVITKTPTENTNSDKEYSWDDWDREHEESENAGGNTGATEVSIDPSVNTAAGKTVVNYLMQKGLSKEAAIGAAKIFKAESGIIPGIRNKEEMTAYGNDKAGIGIAQWSNQRRKDYQKYMTDHGYTTPTLENELDFFIEEGKTRPAFWNAFTNAASVQDAVNAMYYGYENGTSGAMATQDQIIAAYTPAYKKLYGKDFDINSTLNARYQAQI